MWIADKYIDYVKDQTVKHPGESWNKMLLGFQANKYRMKLLPKKGISKGYQKLEAMMMSFVADALSHPDPAISADTIWRTILLITPRTPGSRLRSVPIIKPLWALLTAVRCLCRNMPLQPLCPATET